ncbi:MULTISPECIES: type IV pilus modification protein PilV [unclassified Neptuniibacter]|uniref:type IV pilus modification protein PilV n=1 Tax=unclassified Neptuniibacter TaxID=2630693 RepID=UPI000C480B0A|nr:MULTISPECIES: type IV pilus modification protein PilV [unclassified Neptuniibacter]MAY42819.1 type IV pilus modification protein PilV [Oceanospirillaceae bacterium]|tara:strand:- start:13516 stop:13962 length:447 start_codon:yes stop_codon:yes gene_type:complete
MIDSKACQSKKQKGTTLIEVLIAIVIISIGLLSVAALQTVALKSNNGSYLRSQATFLAYDLADRIRAAPDSAENGDYNDGQGGDRAEWDARVVNQLGSGASGQVVMVIGSTANAASITIQWNDNRARIRAASDADESVLTSFNYQMEF